MNATIALVRIAVRNALRNKLRSFLVFALIALLVGAGNAFATVARSTVATADDFDGGVFGQADLLIEVGPEAGKGLPADVSRQLMTAGLFSVQYIMGPERAPDDGAPDWLAAFDPAEFVSSLGIEDGDAIAQSRSVSSGPVQTGPYMRIGGMVRHLVDIDLANPLMEGIYKLVDGQPPAAPDEIVVASNTWPWASLEVGDDVDVRGTRFSVVGLAVQPAQTDYSHSAIVSPAGFDRAVAGDAWVTHQFRIDRSAAGLSADIPRPVIDGAPGSAIAVERPGEITVETNSLVHPSRMPVVVPTVLTAVFGLQIALVAASAFAVGVRRRVVEFGQLMTAGADAGHIRRLVLAEALVLGVSGAVAGTALGVLVASRVVIWGAELNFGGLYPSGVRLEPIDWIGPAVVGVAAAVLAAWWPARSISSVPATTALAGRLPTAAPRRRIPLWGIAVAAIGTLGTVISARRFLVDLSDTFLLLTIASIVLMFVGFLGLIGTALAFGGVRADRLPLKARLVARQSDRHRPLAWASVGAFVAALAVPVIVAASMQAYPPNRAVPDNHISLMNARVPSLVEGTTADARDQVIFESFGGTIGEAVGPGTSVAVIGPRQDPTSWSIRRPGSLTSNARTRDELRSMAVATPALVEALEISDADIARLDDETALLLSGQGGSVLEVPGAMVNGRRPIVSFDLVAADLGDVIVGNPRLLISEAAAKRLGEDIEPIGALYVTESPIAEQVIDDIFLVAAASWEAALEEVPLNEFESRYAGPVTPSLSIGQPSNNVMSPTMVRWVAIAAAAALAAMIAVIGAALAAVELDRDIESMITTGAAPSMRRWLLGAQTTYHLLLAAVLAIPLAVLVFWAAVRGDENAPAGLTVPWMTIAVVGIGIPLIVGGVVALLFPSGKPVVSRRLS